MEILDWSPSADKFLKHKEIEIHDLYHEDLSKKELTTAEILETPKRKMRIQALHKALNQAKIQELNGQVLDIGAGDGWCSAYMLLNFPKVEKVYSMEINDAAINSLIPKVLKTTKADQSKSIMVKGSFNDIKLKNHFDYVVAMGAIHHSNNLYKTFKNVWEALKPGGWFIAQEPFMPDFTKNSYYSIRESQEINFKGILSVKNSERTDLFYRECEYRTAALHAGFDFDFIKMNTGNSFLKQLKSKLANEIKVKNMAFFAQKPLDKLEFPLPTSWEEK